METGFLIMVNQATYYATNAKWKGLFTISLVGIIQDNQYYQIHFRRIAVSFLLISLFFLNSVCCNGFATELELVKDINFHQSGSGGELWQSDGTTTGTVMVKDIRLGSNSSSPRYLTNINGTLYFSAGDTQYGVEHMMEVSSEYYAPKMVQSP